MAKSHKNHVASPIGITRLIQAKDWTKSNEQKKKWEKICQNTNVLREFENRSNVFGASSSLLLSTHFCKSISSFAFLVTYAFVRFQMMLDKIRGIRRISNSSICVMCCIENVARVFQWALRSLREHRHNHRCHIKIIMHKIIRQLTIGNNGDNGQFMHVLLLFNVFLVKFSSATPV